MRTKDQLHTVAEQTGGILSMQAALESGVPKTTIYRFLAENAYEKISKGIYLAPGGWPDEEYLLQLRCPNIIFSHESALWLHRLSDRIPPKLTITAKRGYNPTHLTAGNIVVHTVKIELHELGLTTGESSDGHTIRIYDKERTICDIVRNRKNMDPQVFYGALRQYAQYPEKDMYTLLQYAGSLGVQNLVRNYMEVLI